MIPEIGTLASGVLEEAEEPSYTYKMDFAAGRIAGRIDELEAVRQAIHKILLTSRFNYEIYSFDYGCELERLIGTNPLFLQAEVQRLVEEALLQDDRIQAVRQVRISASGDRLTVAFTAVTHYGIADIVQEVSAGV